MSQLFGKKLRYLRHEHHMTQGELAEQLGLTSHSHIAKLEGDQDVPSLSLLLRVACVFVISTDYLLRDRIPVEEVKTDTSQVQKDADLALKQFGTRLRMLRLQQNLTQNALAQNLHLARQSYVSNLESGRKIPSLDLVVRIADFFGITTDHLLLNNTTSDISSRRASKVD